MTRKFFVAVALVAVLAVGAVAAPAAGQDGNGTTANETTADGPAAGQTVERELSDTMRITGWEWSNGTMSVTIEAELPARVTVADSGALVDALSESGGAKAVDVPEETYTVQRGTTTIEYRPEVIDGQAAVTVSGPGGAVLLRTGSITASRPAVPWSTVQMLVLGTAAAVGGLGVLLVRRRHEDEDLDYQRAT